MNYNLNKLAEINKKDPMRPLEFFLFLVQKRVFWRIPVDYIFPEKNIQAEVI